MRIFDGGSLWREGSFRESCAGVSERAVFWWLALEKAVFGNRVFVGDKSQLVFWWLELARRMYQTDFEGRTCLCYSQTSALPRRCFCASVFRSFHFSLVRILFIYGFVLCHLSPGGRTTLLFNEAVFLPSGKSTSS